MCLPKLRATMCLQPLLHLALPLLPPLPQPLLLLKPLFLPLWILPLLLRQTLFRGLPQPVGAGLATGDRLLLGSQSPN